MIETLLALTPAALICLAVASALLVVIMDWRISFVSLFIVYAGVAVLMAPLVLLEVVVAKLLMGLLVVSILTLTGAQLAFGRSLARDAASETGDRPALSPSPTNLPFRVLAVTMASVAALYVATRPAFVLPGLDAAPAVNTASYFLMTLGLLNLGLTEEPLNAGMGLLVVLLGFELMYVAVEPSLAIVALLAGAEFAIALAVSYLAVIGHRPAAPSETA